jgi:LysR family transcriptional regulator, benzoate and cis,cis-muconate-responsive activator of ben and cat genes
LRAFDAIAQTLHFGRAAERLGIAQPTISKELRRLEHAIGVPLFNRSAGGTTLTPAGEHLRQVAAEVLEQVRVFETAATRIQREKSGTVTIAASPSVVNALLPDTLRAIDDHQLELTLEPMEVETGEVLAAVESGCADLGVGHLIGEPTHAVKRQLGRDGLRTVLHRSLARRAKGRIDLSRLANVPFLLWPRERNPVYYDYLMDVCRSRGLEPLVLTGTSRISGSWRYFLEDGRAFSLVPEDFAVHEVRSSVVAYELDPPAYVPLEVAWTRHPSPEVTRILEVLVELTRDRRKAAAP